MRREILMPRLSEQVEEGVLVTWFVERGATVREGDLVAEVQVEKTSFDVVAPASGQIGELLFAAGDVVSQEAPIATVETAEAAEAVGEAAPSAPGAGPASPAARRLARELGVDLARVTGTGPGGRIQEADVRAAAAGTGAATGGTASTGAGAVPATIPLTAMRRTIADRLTTWLAQTAQLTLTAEVDVTDLGARLADWSASWGRRASYTDAIVRSCALALDAHPRIAATWSEEGLRPAARIDIGVAVALDDGLIVPVVRDAHAKSLATIGAEVAALADRARAGLLTPAETSGACFTITNLGAYRIDAFTPVLDPPQTAILGVGRARPRPAVRDGAVVARTLVVLSLTFDHRVVDGAPAAAFLDAVAGYLEYPDRLEG